MTPGKHAMTNSYRSKPQRINQPIGFTKRQQQAMQLKNSHAEQTSSLVVELTQNSYNSAASIMQT